MKTGKWSRGFTLIELSVVLVIVGIVISIVATVLPSLIQSAKVRKARAILEKADYALEGYLTASGRLPYADSGTDGIGDSGTYFGNLPYRDLGLSSGDDAWANRMKYGVNENLTSSGTTTFCTTLQSGCTPFSSTVVHINQNGTLTNMAYVVVSGGPKDLDGSNGFFDGLNGDDDAEFGDPNQVTGPTYDDLMIARSCNEVSGIQGCGSGTGTGGSGTGTSAEICDDPAEEDEDGDGYANCYDQDCYGVGSCGDGPPTEAVKINESALSTGTVGASYSDTVLATGGTKPYTWNIVSSQIPGLSIGTLSGSLTGTVDVCAGTYDVTVRVVDAASPATEDTHSFSITVQNDTHVITPEPTGGTDFTCNSGTCTYDFEVSGALLGDYYEWSLTWQGDDPGGFQLVRTGERTAQLRKTGDVTEGTGTYSFQLKAWDADCATNEVTSSCCYHLEVTSPGVGGPLTANMEAQWHLDDCTWNGTSGEVTDSGDSGLDGTAQGGAITVGSGKHCRAGYFDGTDDVVNMGDVLNGTLGSSGSAFTVAAWIYPFSLSTPQSNHNTQNCFIAKASDTKNDNLEIGVTSTGKVHVYLDTQGKNTYTDFGPAGAVVTDTWTFVAVTYDSGTLTVTINADRYENTSTWSGGGNLSDATGSPFTIGGTLHSDIFFQGKIDEVMVFSRALSQDDLEDLRNLTHSCAGSCYGSAVAAYRMENFPWTGAEDEVLDSGTGGSNGKAVSGGSSGTLPSQTTPSGGKLCRSGVFTRTDLNNGGYLDLGDPSDGDLDPGTNGWTVSAWIKWDGTDPTGYHMIYHKYQLYEATVRNGYLYYAWRPHWAWDGGTSFPVTADTWTYVTTVYDGVRQILYKDGNQVYTRSQTGSIGSSANHLLVGAGDWGGSKRHYFGGQIDELKIYNRALSEKEILADMGESRDCTTDSVIISTTSLPQGTVASAYSTVLSATGGTTPYGWEIVAPNPISGLSIVPSTGELSGTINACAGDHDITIRVTDAGGAVDERTYTLTVVNGTLSISPASPQTFNCTSSTFSQDFTVSGPRIGSMGSWTVSWLGTNPGGFEVISTGANTARFRKIGSSTAGVGYQFKLTAADASCSDNQLDSGYYLLNVSGDGANQPYYYGLVGEWRMDECSWDGTTGEITDSTTTGADGESHNMDSSDTPARSLGKTCRSAALNLDGATDQYVTLGHEAFQNLGDFTLSLWFRIDSTSSSINTLFSGARAGAYNNLLIYLNSACTALTTWVNNIQTGTFSIGSSVSDGLWHHLVWTRRASDGSEVVYVDQTALTDSRATANTANVSLDSGGVIIGQEQDSLGGGFAANQVFHGWIDEVLVYNRVLSQTEVNTLYTLTRTCSGSCYTSAVAQYRMDESSWTAGQADDVQDSSGNGYHGTPYGSAAVNTSDSHLCYAGEFSNNDSYVAVTGLPVSTTSGEQTTVCFWMKWAGNGSEMPIGWEGYYDLFFRGTTQLGFNTGAGDLFGISGADALAGSWHHVAAVFNNNAPLKNQLYIDGVLQPSTLLAGTPVNRTVNSTLYLSGWDTGTDYKFDGLLDEVNIYTRGLSASEVVADMNGTHTCPGGP